MQLNQEGNPVSCQRPLWEHQYKLVYQISIRSLARANMDGTKAALFWLHLAGLHLQAALSRRLCGQWEEKKQHCPCGIRVDSAHLWSLSFCLCSYPSVLWSCLTIRRQGQDRHRYHLLRHLRTLPWHFTYVISFTSHTSPLRKVLSVPFYRCKNLRHRDLSYLFKITQLQN